MPVRFGEHERFAIDCITPLGAPIAAFERRAYSLPLCAPLDGLEARAALALVEDRDFPKDEERDLETLERDYFVFGPVVFDALLGEAFGRQRVLLFGSDGASRLVAMHAAVLADQRIAVEELRATLVAPVEWGVGHAGFVAANEQQTLGWIS